MRVEEFNVGNQNVVLMQMNESIFISASFVLNSLSLSHKKDSTYLLGFDDNSKILGNKIIKSKNDG
jgi:hypothetical protein